MTSTKTELEWGYTPAHLFEVPMTFGLTDGQVRVDAGKATLELTTAVDPVPPGLRVSASEELQVAFELWQMLTRKSFSLSGPSEVQHHDSGGRTISVSVGVSVTVAGHADAIVTDAQGNVIADSRADRIAVHEAFVAGLLAKAIRSSTLRQMIRSYSRSVEDPGNELAYLYEVRDAAAKHYGREAVARSTLGISRTEWQELGCLANDAPLRQGRHRGRHLSRLRDATSAELDIARTVARKILKAFAATV